MRNYLQQRYSMTDQGVDDLVRAIKSNTWSNLSKFLPSILGFIFIRQMVDRLLGTGTFYPLTLWHYLGMIAAMFILMCVIARHNYLRLYPPIYKESANIRIEVANRLREIPLSYFGRRDISDLSATIMSDLNVYETLFSHAVPQFYSTIVSTIVIAIILLAYHFKLALAVLWVIPLAYGMVHWSKKLQRSTYKASYDASRQIHEDVQSGIDQIQELKSYSLEDRYLGQLADSLAQSNRLKMKGELIAGVFLNLANICLKFGIVSVALVGLTLYQKGQVDLMTYLYYLMISVTIYSPIQEIFNNLSMMMYLDQIIERIGEIRQLPLQAGEAELAVDNYDIEFDRVSFAYEEGIQVLEDVSLTAKQGEITAFVGPSGSGKSTLARLAARFWDTDQGVIRLGGQDISQVRPEELLKHYAIVFQDVVLFNGSVKDNIAIGKEGATDEEIFEAGRLANCDEFVADLPDGYDTLIGENGQKLSGGQRQRISIARALLKDAPIILLDEATASLDVGNESQIQAAIGELIKDKTVIMIAHRMRTIRHADQIVVLDDGRIQEMGRADELIQAGGLFKSMVDQQLDG